MSTTSKTVRGKRSGQGLPLWTYPGGARRAFENRTQSDPRYGNQSGMPRKRWSCQHVWPHQGQAFATCTRKREVLEHDSTSYPGSHAEREERPRHIPPGHL